MMKLRIHVVLLLLGWIGCMSLMYASDPIVRSFSVMERNHIRVKTPELFANGNSFEIHLENLSDSMWCFPLPKGKVISAYGARGGHSGSDIKTCANDTIRCVFDGVVRMAKHYGGYGKVIVVRHDNGLETIYGHLSKQLVEENQLVKAGEVIGLGGNTGRSTGSHLHFETRFLGIAINPIYMFDFPKQDIVADTYTFRRTQGSKRAGSHDTQVADGTIRYHKVKSGDTLSRIAKLRGVSVSTLCKLNRIKPTTTLRIGQVLRCS